MTNTTQAKEFIAVDRAFLKGVAEFLSSNVNTQQNSFDEPPDYASEFDYRLDEVATEIFNLLAADNQAALASAEQAKSTSKTEAAKRVQKYLDERAKSRQLDQEEITCLHSGDEREAVLLVSDLRALIAEQAQAVAPSMDSIYAAWRAVGADLAGLSWDKFQAAISAAPQTQAVSAEEKEAARYRWLRDIENEGPLSVGKQLDVHEEYPAYERVDWLYGEELDAAIDAAIDAAPSSEGSRP